ncbi:hypothetical protein [Ligilactobacillus agilis]|uniref:hypothetical protein n=1 Tax=Ligilactobacillus agilis TaxID=1601 RepID=UPI0019577626|nr:hypothetical protein [Ligilactobacillus agilis]MBM6763082.1 hypothetical protein [Ligilactobacillus agilis]
MINGMDISFSEFKIINSNEKYTDPYLVLNENGINSVIVTSLKVDEGYKQNLDRFIYLILSTIEGDKEVFLTKEYVQLPSEVNLFTIDFKINVDKSLLLVENGNLKYNWVNLRLVYTNTSLEQLRDPELGRIVRGGTFLKTEIPIFNKRG